MKGIQKIIALYSLIVISQQSFNFSEKLQVENLRDKSKSLFAFEFEFNIDIDFEQIDQEVYMFSRSVLENIFISANARATRVETACGSINNLYLKEKHIGQQYYFPVNGMKLMTNYETNFNVLLQNLAEIFKLTKASVKKQNHYLVQNQLSQQKSDNLYSSDYWFAQDPTDFICTNNIEQIKKYFPCSGKSGLISMIDQTKLFQADYISIVSELKYKEQQKRAKILIQINTVLPKQDYEQKFDFGSIKQCVLYNNSKLIIDSLEQQDYSSKINLKQNITQLKQAIDKLTQDNQPRQVIQDYIPELKSERYMGDKWQDFRGNLVHELSNNINVEIRVQTTEFMIWQFQPIVHEIQVYRRNQLQQEKINYTLEVQENQSYKFQFYLDIQPNEHVRIVIPIHKLMKSFENYPHDPQRGHDLISGSILYQIRGQSQINHITSNNLIMRLPEPDFSMPFNIITYVCVLLGYVFLTFFLNSTTRPK